MIDALWAAGLSVAGLGVALVLLGCIGWEFVSRETRRNGSAG